MSRIKAIAQFGQQIWLDNLSRQLLDSGELARWINEDAIAGVTSNPAIFYNAMRSDAGYQAEIVRLKNAAVDAEKRFEMLVLPDVRKACDLFTARHSSSGHTAGFVSFEVSPALADDAAVCGRRSAGRMQ